MRDSPGFKIVNELKNKGFKVATHDPFFKKELIEKYIIVNKLGQQNFEILDKFEDDIITKFSCLCVVEHHNKTKLRLEQIYHHGQIPMIYDCQNRLEKIAKSESILISFGGHH